jgi:DNA-binding transcriptional ArsR family regulator
MSVAAASSDVFRAVADPTRRAILDLLREGDRSVRELAHPFRMSQPAVSQHLRALREAGLVRARQAGRQRLYRIDPRPLQALYEWAARYKPLVDPFGHVWALASAEDATPTRRPPSPPSQRPPRRQVGRRWRGRR